MPVASPTAGASAPPAGRPVDVVVAGAAGRMGTRVVACLQGAPDLRLVGALEAPAHPALGRDAGELAGVGRVSVAGGGGPATPVTPRPGPLACSLPEAAALGRDLGRAIVCGRKGLPGERTRSEIAVLSLRSGDVVGEHTVSFGSLGERLELTHRAHSRDTLARGALRAVRFVAGRPPGLYSMQDVLGLT